MIKFEINKEQYNALLEKDKLFTFLSSEFSDATFNIGKDSLEVILKGGAGIARARYQIEAEGEDRSFRLDYPLFKTAICKFNAYDTITVEIDEELKIYAGDDEICLGIEEAPDVEGLYAFLDRTSSAILSGGHKMTLTEGVMDKINLASCFLQSADVDVNAIGLNHKGAIFADPNAILLAYFGEEGIDEETFSGIPEGEDYIKVHKLFLQLMPLLIKTNPDIMFAEDYEKIYWKDENSELVMASDYIDFTIPTLEEMEELYPQGEGHATVSAVELKKALDFFLGLYDERAKWNPIKFSITAGREVVIKYDAMTKHLTKTLRGSSATQDGEFQLESGKVLQYLNKLLGVGGENLEFDYDEESVGILVKSEVSEVLFAKTEG